MARCCKPAAGQSLIEVVVAVGAMSLLLVALLALVSLTLKNSRLAKDRARAVTLAQEGMELMRSFRDYNWSQFLARADGVNYNLPADWTVGNDLNDACAPLGQIDNFFWRCVRLTNPAAGQVAALVTVSWREGAQVFSTQQASRLNLWQR